MTKRSIRLPTAISLALGAVLLQVSLGANTPSPYLLHLKAEPSAVPSCTSWEEGSLIDEKSAWVSLIRTMDGGATWARLVLSESDLRVLGINRNEATPLVYEGILPTYFSDLRNGWLFPSTPESGRIWRSRDGGATWSAIAEAFEAVKISSAGNGWGVTSPGSDRKQNYISLDGGSSWSTCGPVMPDTIFMEAPYFLDAKRGWVVQYARECADCAADYFIAATTDGGCNWERLWKATTSLSDSSRFFFLNPQLGWLAAGEDGLLLTRDGGRNWERIEISAEAENVRSVFFTDEERGWIIDLERSFHRTDDGGNSWAPVRRREISATDTRTSDGRAWKEAMLLQMLARAGCR